MTFMDEVIISGVIGGFLSKGINDGVDALKYKAIKTKKLRIKLLEKHENLFNNIRLSDRKIYPNDLCPCGSGKKVKMCYGRLLE